MSRILPSRRRDFIETAFRIDTDECIIWPFAIRKSSGYAAHDIFIEGKKINVDAHRYVCELANGKAPKGSEAAHSCGNRVCINPNHLKWATPLENMEDAKRHGTLIGGGRGRQRIFDRDRAEIKASKASHLEIARRYGLDPAYVGKLRRMPLRYDL